MGYCMSFMRNEAEPRSHELVEGKWGNPIKCKILLLGSGESGKSTIFKQMKIIHQNGFSEEELVAYKTIIYKNLLESAQYIIFAMRKLGMDCVDANNRAHIDKIMDYKVSASQSFCFSEEVACAVHELWRDPVISEIMDYSSQFYVLDNTNYFLTEALRIGTPTYIPTHKDILHARAKSSDVTELRFSFGSLAVHLLDVGGQRTKRKKWIHCFAQVTSVIFCTVLSEYNQVLEEEQHQNRMAESLALFDSIVNSQWFADTSIILLLNKLDIFRDKVPKVPLEKYFPEYAGGADINKAAKFILWKFMSTNNAQLSVHPHLVQATDTNNLHLIFRAVTNSITQNALRHSDVL